MRLRVRHEPVKPPDNGDERERADTTAVGGTGAHDAAPNGSIGMGDAEVQHVGVDDDPFGRTTSRCDEKPSDNIADEREASGDVVPEREPAEKPEEPSPFEANNQLSTTHGSSDHAAWSEEDGRAFPDEGEC
jgi:hypothetical protein